ncbi:Cof-type HAD-IIB family hydrolase [Eubacteriales bacterium OttesenSCG-928-M02]|nr:Cof-type HAD-IIB family hydrolase [Eubacteriales bacterium OttesenSCG-928-M02]
MANIKLIVTDLDGTFLMDQENPHPDNRAAVLAARERGIKVCGCTARNWACSKRIANLGGMEDAFIINGGGGIVQAKTGEALLVNRFPKGKAKAVMETLLPYIQKLNCVDTLVTATTEALINENKQRILDHPELFDPLAREYFYLCKTEQELVEKLEEGCQGIMCHVPAENRALVKEKLEQLGGLSLTGAGGPSLHVMVAGATKGAGVRFLMEYYGLKQEEILAIGDNENDISMMEAAGRKIAVGNATKDLKSVVDVVVAPCDAGGFAQAVYAYAL